ncbi:hypothetical protein McanMca71_003005 [Microsporum canis]|uniref:Uncharacterized protein n=1 Tax=Arthroderma otae (strain ATCC MYA-4605 / CBS 113480) TaxID=554155 RepID=C5G0D4_ARTOC|nr:uncharacterized protein MCYG_08406 [Microsporum canis CBS 113480]EEQ35587.1 predicted protein [Microsporum canis CBS 113480]
MASPFQINSYNITVHGPGVIPVQFMEAQINNIYVEFLRVSTEGMTILEKNLAKNHVIIKMDFVRSVAGYDGARLAMDVDYDAVHDPQGSYVPGKMVFKPVKYRYSSNSSLCTFEIRLNSTITVSHLIEILLRHNLQFFHFVIINDKYYGCRDFITQALALLGYYRYVQPVVIGTLPSMSGLPSNIYKVLGMRFPSGGEDPLECLISKGWFSAYGRIESSDMGYGN